MKTWLRILVCTIEGLIVLGVVYNEPAYCVRGTLWGEAFFDGKPTSYWRGELERWDSKVHHVRPAGWCASEPRIRYVTYSRHPTWLEQQRERWLSANEALEQVDTLTTAFRGPKILVAGEEAAPVLQALLDDPSPKVRRFAQIGLGLKSEIADDE